MRRPLKSSRNFTSLFSRRFLRHKETSYLLLVNLTVIVIYRRINIKSSVKMPRNKHSRKRKFYGNRFVTVSNEGEQKSRPNNSGQGEMSTRAKKLKLSEISQSESEDQDDYYIIVNMRVIKSIIGLVGQCKSCDAPVEIQNDLDKRKGFSYCLKLNCTNCGWEKDWYTSAESKKEGSPGRSMFDVNARVVLAFREIGQGYKAISTFGTSMNMPPPMQKNAYSKINSSLHTAYKTVADLSMKNAAKEVFQISKQTSDVRNCQVSVDGTWQKRGYSSLNGVVSVISSETKKCLDVAILSKFCKACQHWSTKTEHPKYEQWKASHVCKANHSKSSGSMESLGAVAIFQRSVENYNLRYTEYIGDGDSSSFQEVELAKPYGHIGIKKLECVGHVQKRVGTRCRNLRKSLKGTKLSDGKGISGKGRLTDKAINTLQNYYGMAIRTNSNDVLAMKKAVGAVLFHCSDSELESERHKFCPNGADSWCKWQSDKVTGKQQYKKKLSLPVAIKEKLKPLFKELSSDELLTKCLHGLTQNVNESLNNIIWKKCPKRIFAGRDVVEMAVNSAVIDYNDGLLGICKVAEELGLKSGVFMQKLSHNEDQARIKEAGRKSTEKGKKRRKKLRAVKKGFIDEETELEGTPSYDPGAF